MPLGVPFYVKLKVANIKVPIPTNIPKENSMCILNKTNQTHKILKKTQTNHPNAQGNMF